MAKAVKNVEKKKVVKEVEVEEVTYTLTLTEKEAFVLKAMCGNIYGNDKARDITTDIYYALDKVPIAERPFKGAMSISFNDAFIKEVAG